MSLARCDLHPCPDGDTLAQALAADIAGRLRAAVAERGQALLAVSGGRSPVPLFQQLARQALPWARVTVLLVDERCVPPGHADSNSALVRQHLLQGPAAAAHWLPFFDTLPGFDARQGLARAALLALTDAAQQRLSALPWPLDVAVLGMGEDGHTASLFLGAAGLAQALLSERPLAWTVPATAPHARLTLTLPTLLAARCLVLPLAGANKHAVFRQACAAPTADLPISLVLHQAPRPVHVWQAP
ncbi:6-phosphogluconolactonase [Hydrogenophaga sp. OTU3427]|uniref:6-phosphogluconolactonase n=1 Tax=Hydrogenophaga sp. OTU3427 TaxID=3043856 RepID=UPI00313EBC0C